MTYAQWESWKKSENRYMWDTYQKMGKNASADRKEYDSYVSLLGRKAQNTFRAFQQMKYRAPHEYEELKKRAKEKAEKK